MVEGEEAEDGVADDIAGFKLAPFAGIVGAIGGAVVAHDEDVARLNDFVGFHLRGGVFGFVFGIGVKAVFVLGIVHRDSAVFYDYPVTRQADDTLHKYPRGIFGEMEDDDFAAGWNVGLVLAEGPGQGRLSIADFGDNEVVRVMEVRDHTSADDVVGLKNKVVQNKHNRDRENDPRKNSTKYGGKTMGDTGNGRTGVGGSISSIGR